MPTHSSKPDGPDKARAEEMARRRPELWREAGEVIEAIEELERRVLATARCGRVLKRRIQAAFYLAARLGTDTLADFVDHKPWLSKPRKTGRR